MTDVETNISEQKPIVNKQEKVYKTKDYVRRAKHNYEIKKYAEDPEYRKKKLESIKQSQKKNPEKYREYSRIYMREYRAKKKAEKQSQSETTIKIEESQNTQDNVENNLEHNISNQLTTLIIEEKNN